MSEMLPHTGQVSTDDLARALQDAPRLLDDPGAIEVRTVAVLTGARWYNLRTHLWLRRDEDRGEDQDIDLGSLRLISHWYSPEEVNSADGLRLAMAQWRLDCGVGSGYQLQPRTSVDRYGSFNLFHPRPCWKASVHEQVTDEAGMAVPSGPFFDADRGIVADSASSLASEWLSDRTLSQVGAVRNEYRLIIPDTRARIRALKADGQRLAVIIAGHFNGPLKLGAIRTGFHGEREKLVADIHERRGELEFRGSVRELDLWLFTDGAHWLDHYHEDANRVSWGPSLYNQSPRMRPGFADLEAAVDAGENEKIEFKEWIALEPRDNKSAELLKAACAFANTKGGAIFIGISDSAELIGTDRPIREAYAPKVKRPLPELRDAYVGDVRRYLNEGVRPSVNPDCRWLAAASLQVLRIEIPKGDEGPYSLTENGDIYVRRGATSRKARASDYLEGLGRAF